MKRIRWNKQEWQEILKRQGINPDRYKLIEDVGNQLILKDRLTDIARVIDKERRIDHENDDRNISR